MKLRDLMTQKVTSVNASANVQDAARIMRDLNVGSVPVVENNRLSGIVTDRDIVLRCVAEGKDLTQAQVKDVMSNSVVSASPDMDVHEAARLMSQHQVRRLPVVENGQLVGIVAIGDLATEQIFENEAGEALSNISKPSNPM